jgi:hypothetical protein
MIYSLPRLAFASLSYGQKNSSGIEMSPAVPLTICCCGMAKFCSSTIFAAFVAKMSWKMRKSIGRMVAKWKGENDVDGKEKDDCIFCLLCATEGMNPKMVFRSVGGIGELMTGALLGRMLF